MWLLKDLVSLSHFLPEQNLKVQHMTPSYLPSQETPCSSEPFNQIVNIRFVPCDVCSFLRRKG